MTWRFVRALCGAVEGAHIAYNAHLQVQVTSGRMTPKPHTRLAAFQHTLGFDENQIGGGVRVDIQLIHLVLGSVGQGQIGTVFSQPHIQDLMATPLNAPDAADAQRALADEEYAFWVRQYRVSSLSIKDAVATFERPTAADFDDMIGGILGATAPPQVRASIQTTTGALNQTAPSFLKPSVVSAAGWLAGLTASVYVLRRTATAAATGSASQGSSSAGTSSSAQPLLPPPGSKPR